MSDNFGFPEPAKDIHVSDKTKPIATIDDDPEVDVFDRAAEDYTAHEAEPEPDLGIENELGSLLNKYSAENVSGTPDFILAKFLIEVLKSYNEAVSHRAQWRGESVELNTDV